MADQNLPMSDEIPTVVGHNVWTIFFNDHFILDIGNPSGQTWVIFFSAGIQAYFIEMTTQMCEKSLHCISLLLAF